MASNELKVCTTELEIDSLCSLIHQEDRIPVIVGSLKNGEAAPRWDAPGLIRRLEDEAIIFVVSAEASYFLTEKLGGRQTLFIQDGSGSIRLVTGRRGIRTVIELPQK